MTPGGVLQAPPRILFSPLIILGLVTVVISMTSQIVVLSRVDLSFAYPFVVTAYAFFVFREDVNRYRLAGIALICLGTVLTDADGVA